MKINYLNYNNQLLPDNEPILKAQNRGFKFGDGVFESMRMLNGKLAFADLHADRIKAAMKALKLDGYNYFDSYFLKQKTTELLKKNRWFGNARFRLSIFRAGEGLFTPLENKAEYILESLEMPSSQYELNKKGLIMGVYDDIPKAIHVLSNYKTLNALPNVMAGVYQKQKGWDEAFLLNQNGFLCESTSSNVFIKYQDQLYTPALSEGCVAGVMRNVIIMLASMEDIHITEAQINPEILKEADEVFITNASSGIRWVMGYGRKRYFNEMAKYLHLKLNNYLR
ncbi:MAG: 4-amino-4-deoxychorismate lyase [Pedobacter sp.]|nr:MAG: 4-amino-4-deoxychorismate lyase [Pedobacter sp.]